MTLAQVKSFVVSALQKSESDFTVGTVNLLIAALNRARISLQQAHDFETYGKKVASVTVGSSGGDLTTATVSGIDTFRPLTFFRAYRIVDGVQRHIPVHSVGSEAKRLYRQSRRNSFMTGMRYRGDLILPDNSRTEQLLIEGFNLSLSPVPTSDQTIYLVCTVLANDIADDAADSYTDWTLDFCSEYLIWQTIVELNHVSQTFVYREEGTLGPPEKLAEAGLAKAIAWDAAMTGNIRATGLDRP